jgi:hypothetical protein
MCAPYNNQTLEVTSEMAEFLGMSEREKSSLEADLHQTLREMEDIAEGDLIVIQKSSNRVVYEIPADPRGQVLEAKLRNEASAVLGSDRADLFLPKNVVYEPFFDFTKNRRRIEIICKKERGPGGPDAPPDIDYTINQTVLGTNGMPFDTSSFSSTTLSPPLEDMVQKAIARGDLAPQ